MTDKIPDSFALRKRLDCFCSLLWIIIHLYYKVLSNYYLSNYYLLSEQSIVLYTSELIVLQSAVTLSINACRLVLMAAIWVHAITLPPPRLTDDVVGFRSLAVSLHAFLLR